MEANQGKQHTNSGVHTAVMSLNDSRRIQSDFRVQRAKDGQGRLTVVPVRDVGPALFSQRGHHSDQGGQGLIDAGHLAHSNLAHLNSLTPSLGASQVHKVELAAQHAATQPLLHHNLHITLHPSQLHTSYLDHSS